MSSPFRHIIPASLKRKVLFVRTINLFVYQGNLCIIDYSFPLSKVSPSKFCCSSFATVHPIEE